MSIEAMMAEFFETVEPKVENFESFQRNVEAMDEFFEKYYIKFGFISPDESIKYKSFDDFFQKIVNLQELGVPVEILDDKPNKIINLQELGVPAEKIVTTPVFEIDGTPYLVKTDYVELVMSAMYALTEPHKTFSDLLLEKLLHYNYVYEIKEIKNGISPKDFSRTKTFEIRGVKDWRYTPVAYNMLKDDFNLPDLQPETLDFPKYYKFTIKYNDNVLIHSFIKDFEIQNSRLVVTVQFVDWNNDGLINRVKARLTEIKHGKLPVHVEIDGKVFNNYKLVLMCTKFGAKMAEGNCCNSECTLTFEKEDKISN